MLLHHQAIEGLRRALHSRSASSRHRRYPSSGQLSKRISPVLPSRNYNTVLTHSKIQVLATIRQRLYFNATHRAWFLKTRLIFTTAIKTISPTVSTFTSDYSAHLLLALSCVVPCTACSRGNLYQRHLVRFSGLYRIDYMSFLRMSPCDFFIGRQIYLVDWYQFGTCQSFLTHVQGLITAWLFASITSPVWKCSSIRTRAFA